MPKCPLIKTLGVHSPREGYDVHRAGAHFRGIRYSSVALFMNKLKLCINLLPLQLTLSKLKGKEVGGFEGA